MGRADGLGLGPHLGRALGSVRVVALEIDPLDPLMQGQLAAALARPSAARLPRALDDRLKAALRGACPAQAGDDEWPADIRLVALVAQAGRQLGLEPAYSSEVLLSLRGRMAGLRVVSLETAAEQAQALRPRTAAELHASVAGALDDLASGATARLLDRTARIWEAGDMEELARYRQWCECARTPAERALLRRLLDERNPRLAARIAALHARGEPVLAAVGALHMVGPTSVPALLKARGFRVERVR